MLYYKNFLQKKSNQKGFSLVELLIVIAIMGVLAVIAFNAFNGVLVNSKRKTDDQQAKNIEKSYRILATESGKINIGGKLSNFGTGQNAAGTAITGTFTDIGAATPNATEKHNRFVKIVEMLQQKLYFKDTNQNIQSTGPHLNNPKTDGTFSYDPFKPQWNHKAGGKYVGYTMTVTGSTNNVSVIPKEQATAPAATAAVCAYEFNN